jgi:hypothetical protein
MSAGMLALLDLVLGGIGPGWCFVFFAGCALLSIPLLYLLERRGMFWRQKRVRVTYDLAEEARMSENKAEENQVGKGSYTPKQP